MKRAGKWVTVSDNVGATNLLVNRINLRPQSPPFAVFTTLRAGKALGTERKRFHVRRGSSLDLVRYFPPEHCAMSARVVITIALRVRALRTAGFGLSGAASARRLLMPARETEAIILKTFPLGEADRLVSFLGRASGRARGVAAGARRVKNRYRPTLGVLSPVEIWCGEEHTREWVARQSVCARGLLTNCRR